MLFHNYFPCLFIINKLLLFKPLLFFTLNKLSNLSYSFFFSLEESFFSNIFDELLIISDIISSSLWTIKSFNSIVPIKLLNDSLIPGSQTYNGLQEIYKDTYPEDIDLYYYPLYISDKGKLTKNRNAIKHSNDNIIHRVGSKN